MCEEKEKKFPDWKWMIQISYKNMLYNDIVYTCSLCYEMFVNRDVF